MINKIFFSFIVAFLLLLFPVFAEDIYSVEIIGQELTVEFNHYEDAIEYYNTHFYDGENIILREGNTVISAHYALVEFLSNSGCTINTDFIVDSDSSSGYLNGCYGKDGLFLGLNSKGNYAKFEISGVVAWVKLENVHIVPVEDVNTYSCYVNNEKGEFTHRLKNSFSDDRYSNVLVLDDALDFLEQGVTYYSYDSHYFYESIYDCIDDAYLQIHEHAVNSTPYYNYYMYVSNRTVSNYSAEDFREYFDKLGINSYISTYTDNLGNGLHDVLNESMLYESANSLVFYQNVYGANAAMMLSLSLNESAIGRSNLSFNRNNLFGHAAYDSDVERFASRYFNPESSIISHAKKYISLSYSNPDNFTYHGSYFGNKESGMNVSYASDPYWGEKAASHYYKFDRMMGEKDKDSYCLGFTDSSKTVNVMNSSLDVIQTISDRSNCFVILKKMIIQGYSVFEVLLDATDNENGSYDHQKGYVYVFDIEVLFNEQCLNQDKTLTVIADAKGGTFGNGEEVITIEWNKNQAIDLADCYRKGYEFVQWQLNEEDNKVYAEAIYKKIQSIQLEGNLKSTYYIGDRIDYGNAWIHVIYEDDSENDIPLSGLYVSGFNSTEKQNISLTIDYCGLQLEYNVDILEREELSYDEIVIEDDLSNIDEVISMMKDNPSLTFAKRREVENVILNNRNKYRVQISENCLNLGISGLLNNVDLQNYDDGIFARNVFDITIQMIENDKINQIIDNNEYHTVTSFSISGTYKNEQMMITIPVLVSIDIDSRNTDKYAVLYQNEDHLEWIYCKQGESTLTMELKEWGNYYVVSRETLNDNTTITYSENFYYTEQDNSDFFSLILIAVAGFLLVGIGIVCSILVATNKKRRHS